PPERSNGRQTLMRTQDTLAAEPCVRPFRSRETDWYSVLGTGTTGLATLLIVAILLVILTNVIWNGAPYVSWRFITTGTATDMFDVRKAGIFPMIFGTTARVI